MKRPTPQNIRPKPPAKPPAKPGATTSFIIKADGMKEAKLPSLEHLVVKAPTGVNATLGLRYNSGKLRFDLIPDSWTVALAQVFSQGARKYADDNWKKGLSMREVIGCLERHLSALKRGEMYDVETGCHHAAHVAWNALAFMWMHITGKGLHDIPPVEEKLPTMVTPKVGKLKEMDEADGAPVYYPVVS